MNLIFFFIFSFIISWTLNSKKLYAKYTLSSSQVLEMQTINLERPCHRSVPHVSNLGRESHGVENQVHFRRNYTLPHRSPHGPNNTNHIRFDENMIAVHKIFREKIDSLLVVQMCHICQESYLGIQVLRDCKGPVCRQCKNERGSHHFSGYNNMDPSENLTF